MPPQDTTALELVRDALTSLRSDMGRLFERLDQAVSSNQAMHADTERRLQALEAAQAVATAAEKPQSIFERYGWIQPAWKLAWPLLLIFGALWRTAPEPTRAQVKSIAANAAGVQIPDQVSAASTKPVVTPASTTWVAKAAGGPR